MRMATQVCETLNVVLAATPFASNDALCRLVPAVHGANYTEEALQGLIRDGVLARPPDYGERLPWIQEVGCLSLA